MRKALTLIIAIGVSSTLSAQMRFMPVEGGAKAPFNDASQVTTPIVTLSTEKSLTQEELASKLGTSVITSEGEWLESHVDISDLGSFHEPQGEVTPLAEIADLELGVGLFNEFGTYVRARVTNTTSFPHRAIGKISIGCTGTLIGPKHIITAGHCVYDTKTNTWYRNVAFSPARNGGTYPFGSAAWKRVFAPSGWTRDHDPEFDYALVELNEPVGEDIGWIEFAWSESIPHANLSITGYPTDKASGTMWRSTCPLDQTGNRKLFYRCDTHGGMSGSAVIMSSPKGKNVIYGVHAYGGSQANSATRITSAVYSQIRQWQK